MDMISNTAFGVQVDSQSNPDHPMMENANRMMSVNQKGALVKLKQSFRIIVFCKSNTDCLELVKQNTAHSWSTT